MEDAKIQTDVNIESDTEGNSLYQQGQFPSVITTDDLVFELGKEVVDKLNKEKLLKGLLKKSKASEETVINSKKNISEMVLKVESISKKMGEIQESNKLYEEKNRSLGGELSKIRQELKNATRQSNKLTTTNAELTKQKKVSEQENKKLLDKLTTTNAELTKQKKLVEQENRELTTTNAELTKQKELVEQENKKLLDEMELLKSSSKKTTNKKTSTNVIGEWKYR